jgi:hypothetical protein
MHGSRLRVLWVRVRVRVRVLCVTAVRIFHRARHVTLLNMGKDTPKVSTTKVEMAASSSGSWFPNWFDGNPITTSP